MSINSAFSCLIIHSPSFITAQHFSLQPQARAPSSYYTYYLHSVMHLVDIFSLIFIPSLNIHSFPNRPLTPRQEPCQGYEFSSLCIAISHLPSHCLLEDGVFASYQAWGCQLSASDLSLLSYKILSQLSHTNQCHILIIIITLYFPRNCLN